MFSVCARFLARELNNSTLTRRYFSCTNIVLSLKTMNGEETIYVAFPDKAAYFRKVSLQENENCSKTENTDPSYGSVFLKKSEKYKFILALPSVESNFSKYIMSAVPSQNLTRKLSNIVPPEGGCALCTVYKNPQTSSCQDIQRGVCVYFPKMENENEESFINALETLLSEHNIHTYSYIKHEDGDTFTKTDRNFTSNTDYEESKLKYSMIPFDIKEPDKNKTYESHLFTQEDICPVFHGYQRTRLILKQFYEETEIPEVSKLIKITNKYIPESFSVEALQENMKHPFVVVEGLDATGKTTVTQILCEKLNGVRYYTPPEPIQHLRKYFDSLPEIIRRAYYTVGNYIVALQISKECAERPVIMDRYWHSTTAYGIANETSKSDLPCSGHWVYKWPSDLLPPNIVLFLSVSEEVRKQRLDQRQTEKTFEEKNLDKDKLFRQRLYEAYRRMVDPCCIEMDASGSVDTVVKKAMDLLKKHGINCV